jgi:hypothetical protein
MYAIERCHEAERAKQLRDAQAQFQPATESGERATDSRKSGADDWRKDAASKAVRPYSSSAEPQGSRWHWCKRKQKVQIFAHCARGLERMHFCV